MKWLDTLLRLLMDFLYPTVSPLEPLQPPVSVPEPIITPKVDTMINAEKLYQTAVQSLGKDMSPLDKAADYLACMESVDGVWLATFGEHLLAPVDRLSTNRGYAAMLKDKRLELIPNEDAIPGDIVISPTGYSTKNSLHGHTAIRGKNTYMSNDSTTGLWTANYNIPNWKLVFHDTLGFPIYHFRVK